MLESQRAFFIVQDANARQDCFLSRPEWLTLSQLPDTSFAVHQSVGLLVKARILDVLLDIPSLFCQGELLWSEQDISDGVGGNLKDAAQRYQHAVTYLRTRLETLHEEELKPLLLIQDHTIPNHPRQYQDLLLARLECMVLSVLVKLDQMSLLIMSRANLTPDAIGFTYDPAITMERQQIARQAFEYIQSSFPMAAKPLQFGLQQLWSRMRAGQSATAQKRL
jgi:hypothetical protein